MTIQTTLAVLAGSFGVVMGVAPLLQMVRVLKRRRSDDISAAYLAIIALGVTLWTAYGVAINNPALYIANAAGMLSTTATLLVVLHFRRPDLQAHRSEDPLT